MAADRHLAEPLREPVRPLGALGRRPLRAAQLGRRLSAYRLEAGLAADLRDARAHRPEPDDADPPDLHGARGYRTASIAARPAANWSGESRTYECRPRLLGKTPAAS